MVHVPHLLSIVPYHQEFIIKWSRDPSDKALKQEMNDSTTAYLCDYFSTEQLQHQAEQGFTNT